MPSPAPKRQQEIQELPLKMAEGNKFGRYKKINDSETWNFIVSDGALVDFAGYKNVVTLLPNVPGRGIYSSFRGDRMVIVLGNAVYKVQLFGSVYAVGAAVGVLQTTDGDVFMAENNASQIVITDKSHLYVYNWFTGTFLTSGIDFPTGGQYSVFPMTSPGYVAFQNGRIITVDLETNNWYLSGINDALQWNTASTANNHAYVGSLQTKPDTVQAAVPLPGGGNNLMLFGHTVCEQWQDTGGALFPYQRSSTLNIDYGCLNASSIAELDNYIVWLAASEQSGPTIMVTDGGREKAISTDGIDFKMANITDPTNCTGFLFRQDGHLIYQFTFVTDNLSYIYDFNTEMFFSVSDENLNYHIARNVVFFKNDYYFVSLNGGNLYQFGTQYTNFEYAPDDIQQMPRIRITPPMRLDSQRMFIIKSVGFTLENGQQNTYQTYPSTTAIGDLLATESSTTLIPSLIATEGGTQIGIEGSVISNTVTLSPANVDLSVSRDGGATFGNSWRLDMNQTGLRKSRFLWQRLGQANDVCFQFRFNSLERFVILDGQVEVYQ
jgi:hypothetical protein